MKGDTDNGKTRAAIEGEPLPQAGESLRRRMWGVFLERGLPWALTGAIGVVLAVAEWCRYLLQVRATIQGALAVSAVAAGWGVVAWVKARGAMRDFENMRKGLLGERHVGHYLDDVCRGMGYRVLHDVPGEGFNVDHVLVGPCGVFSVETKYRSKPKDGRARMVFDGVRLTRADGYDEEIVKQARRNGDFVRELLAKRLGRRVYVFPVVMLPGWWIEDEGPRPRHVWVMADDVLHTFLKTEQEAYGRLTEEDVGAVYESLAQYVREKRE